MPGLLVAQRLDRLARARETARASPSTCVVPAALDHRPVGLVAIHRDLHAAAARGDARSRRRRCAARRATARCASTYSSALGRRHVAAVEQRVDVELLAAGLRGARRASPRGDRGASGRCRRRAGRGSAPRRRCAPRATTCAATSRPRTARRSSIALLDELRALRRRSCRRRARCGRPRCCPCRRRSAGRRRCRARASCVTADCLRAETSRVGVRASQTASASSLRAEADAVHDAHHHGPRNTGKGWKLA